MHVASTHVGFPNIGSNAEILVGADGQFLGYSFFDRVTVHTIV